MTESAEYFREPFQCFGMWWVPGHDDDVFSGELRYHPTSGLSLTIVRQVIPPRELRPDNALSSYEVLCGRVVDCPRGDVVSLTGCTAIRAVRGLFSGLGTEEFSVDRAYFGVDFATSDDFRFDRADVYIDQLTNWIAYSTLSRGIDYDGEVPTDNTLHFDQNLKIESDADDCRITVEFLKQLPLGFARTVTISETPFFSIMYTEPQPIDYILRTAVFPLQNLSTLASNHISELTAVELSRPGATGKKERVRLLFRQVPERSEPVKYLYAEQMLFTTRDMPFARMVVHWLRFARALPDICDLYFSVVYARGLLRDAAFFMLMQVAEAYHRDRYPGTEIPQDEYDKTKKKSIVASAPEQYRSWLGEKLRYSNELTLRKRLRTLLAEDADALALIVDSTHALVGKLVDTRNYMAHRTDELRAVAASDVELRYLVEKLRILLKLCLLRELGCTPEKRQEIITRHLRLSGSLQASHRIDPASNDDGTEAPKSE